MGESGVFKIREGADVCLNLERITVGLREAGVIDAEVGADDLRFNTDLVRREVFAALEDPEKKKKMMELMGFDEESFDEAMRIAGRTSKRAARRQNLIRSMIKKRDYKSFRHLVEITDGVAQEVIVDEFLRFAVGDCNNMEDALGKLGAYNVDLQRNVYDLCFKRLFGVGGEKLLAEVEARGDGLLEKVAVFRKLFITSPIEVQRKAVLSILGEKGEKVGAVLAAEADNRARVALVIQLEQLLQMSGLAITIYEILKEHIIAGINEEDDVKAKLLRFKSLWKVVPGGDLFCRVYNPVLTAIKGNGDESIKAYFFELYGEDHDAAAVNLAFYEMREFMLNYRSLELFLKEVIGDDGVILKGTLKKHKKPASKVEIIVNLAEMACEIQNEKVRWLSGFGSFATEEEKRRYARPYIPQLEIALCGVIKSRRAMDGVLEGIEDPREQLRVMLRINGSLVPAPPGFFRKNTKRAGTYLKFRADEILIGMFGEKCEKVEKDLAAADNPADKLRVISRYYGDCVYINDVMAQNFSRILSDLMDYLVPNGKAILDQMLVQNEGYERYKESESAALKMVNELVVNYRDHAQGRWGNNLYAKIFSLFNLFRENARYCPPGGVEL